MSISRLKRQSIKEMELLIELGHKISSSLLDKFDCNDSADVVDLLEFATKHKLEISVVRIKNIGNLVNIVENYKLTRSYGNYIKFIKSEQLLMLNNYLIPDLSGLVLDY